MHMGESEKQPKKKRAVGLAVWFKGGLRCENCFSSTNLPSFSRGCIEVDVGVHAQQRLV